MVCERAAAAQHSAQRAGAAAVTGKVNMKFELPAGRSGRSILDGPSAAGSKSRDKRRGAETLELYVFNQLMQERKKAMGLETSLAKEQALSRVKLAADKKTLAELQVHYVHCRKTGIVQYSRWRMPSASSRARERPSSSESEG